MRILQGTVALSATDLANHLSCRHFTTLDLRLAQGEIAEPSWDNPHLRVLQQRGLEHEKAYIEWLRSRGLNVADLSNEPEATATATTWDHRIWSTDWFMRKEQEVQRTLTAFESAVKFTDQLDRGVASPNQGESNHRHRAPSSSARGPRPGVPVRPSIQQYSVGELAQLMRWIASDGQLRTDDEIMDEMVATLGFSRRGARIESAIRGAISRWRAQI